MLTGLKALSFEPKSLPESDAVRSGIFCVSDPAELCRTGQDLFYRSDGRCFPLV